MRIIIIDENLISFIAKLPDNLQLHLIGKLKQIKSNFEHSDILNDSGFTLEYEKKIKIISTKIDNHLFKIYIEKKLPSIHIKNIELI